MLLLGFRTADGGYTIVSAANPLPVTGGGGGGGGDASAANQVTGNASLASIDTKLTNNATSTLQTALNTLIGSLAVAAWTGSGDMSLLAGIKAIATTALSTAPTIVVQEAPSWVYIPAGSTDTAGGNANDLLDCLLVIPATTSPGAVSIEDGAGTNYTLFAGGATSVSTLIPFPIDMRNIQATTAWEITTGANVAVIAFYRPRT